MLTRRNCVLGSAALTLTGCTAREQTSTGGEGGTRTSDGPENANIDWDAHQGEAINLLLIEHWWTDAITSRLNEFEQLTGMTVDTNVIGDQDAYYQQAVVALSSGASTYDGLMVGSLNSGQYMNANWLVPLDEFSVTADFWTCPGMTLTTSWKPGEQPEHVTAKCLPCPCQQKPAS